MRGLESKRILVTGAGGGIGAAVVERLVAEGAQVVAVDLAAPELDGVVDARGVDVTDESSVAAVVEACREAFGGLDGLVAAAGIQASAPTHKLDAATFRKVVDVSVAGTFLAVKHVIPGMLEQADGRIVTFGSTAAVCAAAELTAYAAAKGAVLQLTRSIAVEYADRGIRANCLCPGGTMTPMMRAIDERRTGVDHFRERHPIGRYAEPEEIAAAAAYLLSDDSSFVVGAALMADGGYSCA